MRTDEILLDICDQLRFVLFGLGCALDVEFDHAETERFFDDAEEDQVSVKQYTLYSAHHLRVTGRVDEYEPGTIWLRVESRKPFAPSLTTMAEWAKYQEYHVKRRQNEGY